MNVLFSDWEWHGPAYDFDTQAANAMGGSESTLLKVAAALAPQHQIFVAQRQRTTTDTQQGVQFLSGAELDKNIAQQTFDVVVVMRKPRHAIDWAKRLPTAKIVLWLHDYVPTKARYYATALARHNISIVAVSSVHAGHTAAVLGNGLVHAYQHRDWGLMARWPVRFIYNPVADGLQPDQTVVDKNKLIYLSSPHKGLTQVLKTFAVAHARCSDLRLYIANPSGLVSEKLQTEDPAVLRSIEFLGSLPQAELHQHLRSALCLFTPQNVYPETFGLVYAESNAVGTPVLAHEFGSAAELLSPAQRVDANNPQAVIDTLLEWRNGARPAVELGKQFSLAAVADEWLRLLQQLQSVDKKSP